MDRIPLFPLQAVLFPGMPLPLRIFEPRYHQMLRDCDASGDGFGVVLIQHGFEVGGYAAPHPIGTLARIEQRSEQGSSTLVLARGTKRFRVERLHRDKPYLEGEVRWLEDPSTQADAATASPEVADLFNEYLGLLAKLARVPLEQDLQDLMRRQEHASAWAMACAIGGTLLVPPQEKQPILEAATVYDALRAERDLLGRENARLRILARSVDAHLN